MRRPVVHLYTLCWDEADMLGFFFRHYDSFVDRYVVYDDGSTDGSREILQAHPKVELRDFSRTDPDSFVLSHRAMQNEVWKESRHRADWVVVTAIDEHLHVPGRPMADYLAEQADRGVTLIPALGFDLNHPEMPSDSGLLVERVTRGRPRIAFNKLSVFKPEALRETGFGPGRHAAKPEGDLVLPPRETLQLWHYKHLGFERNATREAIQAERLGRTDREQGLGQHYLWGRDRLRLFWDEMERESVDLVGADADLLAVRPLWWEEQGLKRADPAPLPPLLPAVPGAAPTVSVLVKSYQHAPYVRQTIDSILAQSFQDFEIVVTDDGSTDGTAEILRSYTDPRIRLECWPENRGISTAMNATVARARGRYLAILNSDDWALPGRLRRQVGFLDAHPDISLVFAVPRAVDEDGLPTAPFNNFEHPLSFDDFSRRTWLRYFFFHGNILNAPSAMIRREAYEDAGPYDPRLTNLQDFDMWIRMLKAGHHIHVLPDHVTAFRIRDNHGNASAPTKEAQLRSTFESVKILQQFADFSDALYAEIFDEEIASHADSDKSLLLAALARRVPRVEYQNLALQILFEKAHSPDLLRSLREWGGEIDAMNMWSNKTIKEELEKSHEKNKSYSLKLLEYLGTEVDLKSVISGLESEIVHLKRHNQRCEDSIAHLKRHNQRCEDSIARLQGEVEERQRRIRAAEDKIDWMTSRWTWRTTVPFRLMAREIRRIRSRMRP